MDPHKKGGSIECEHEILLTGAGFTHNFGAPLSSELWSWIFNHPMIESEKRLQDAMRNNFDYESVYYRVIDGDFSASEKEAIHMAVQSAFYRLDEIARTYNRQHLEVDIYSVQTKLFDRFSSDSKHGFVFTLNQDLFVERNFASGARPYLPGIEQNSAWFTPNFKDDIGVHNSCQLPAEGSLENNVVLEAFNYIKLHGSWGWLSAIGTEDMLVIGGRKDLSIAKEPLLKWYFEVFQNVLLQPNRRLLVIGYSFGDDHINDVILKAIENHNLRVYIICPTLPNTFSENLRREIKGGEQIWSSVSGYFPFSLAQMYDQNFFTQRGRLLAETFFDDYV